MKQQSLCYFYRYRYYLYLLKEDPMHGYWDEDTVKGRCILRCAGGYEPSGCHVIRYSHREGKWNHDVPSCQKELLLWGKTKATMRNGVATVLAGAGFNAAGAAAGRIAAILHIPFAPSNWFAPSSWFAYSQSAGVMGSMFSNCEEE